MVVAGGTTAGGVVVTVGAAGAPAAGATVVGTPGAPGSAGGVAVVGVTAGAGGVVMAVTVVEPDGMSLELSEISATVSAARASAPMTRTRAIGRRQGGTGATRVRAATPQVRHQS